MSSSIHSQEKHPLSSGMDHALDGDVQGPVKQLRRPGDNGPAMQSAVNASSQVKQLKASEAAANTAVIQRKKSNETGLPDELKTGIESLAGMSLDHVKVVYNSSKPAEVNALAFAEGSVIHVAPGQEAHLPEEAWHIVQQMQGKVRATTEVNGKAVNNDPELEKEAAEMGAKASEHTTVGDDTQPALQQTGTGQPVKQLKSKFIDRTYDENVKTPIQALSDQVGPYFKLVGLKENYGMHGGNDITPNKYNGSFVRARSATAFIDTNTKSKVDRNDSVIGPYGHFGWMERSIMGRDDRGNLFDGGHLIERSLMEGADGDCHGNLAPQEGKEFNQDIMRGWEHIPEKYQNYLNFTYTMKLGYTDDQYTRTGQELLDAKVVHSGLMQKLAKYDDNKRDEAFKKSVFTFDRWVPYKWSGEIDAGEGKKFPPENFNKGSHYDKLQPSQEDARDRVVQKDVSKDGKEVRNTHSGTITGFVKGLKVAKNNKSFFLGGKRVIKTRMYSGVPQPLHRQKRNDRNGKAPIAKLPEFSDKINILKSKFRLKRIHKVALDTETFSKVGKRKKLSPSTIFNRVKHYPEIKILSRRIDKNETCTLITKLQGIPENALDTATFMDIASKAFKTPGSQLVNQMVYDDNFIEKEWDGKFDEKEEVEEVKMKEKDEDDIEVEEDEDEDDVKEENEDKIDEVEDEDN
jgi:hypothetical protein